MKQKMVVFVSLGNTVVLSHLQSCTRFRKEGRRATGALRGAVAVSEKTPSGNFLAGRRRDCGRYELWRTVEKTNGG